MILPTEILPLRVEALGYAANGHSLLQEISFVLDGHARTIVLGPNGAGKSLLLRLCHGLLKPTAGRITWAGQELSALRAGYRLHGMVFQRPVMLRRSVADNIGYALGICRVDSRVKAERIAEALHLAGLEPCAGRSARVLSGGEQQRLAIVRVWACRPTVLFLDEPTANLDPAAVRAIETLIQTIHESGTRIIMTTHDLNQARRLADEILFLHRGRLLEHTPAETFFTFPASLEARIFVAGDLLS